jgi:N-acetylglucosamine-6-phosphate deacetylase
VDLQVNGFRGLDFNTLPIGPGLTGRMARELWSVGVTTCFPTLITNSPAAIRAGLRAVARDCDADPVAAAAVGGIHLEGPFISPEDGPRGAHERRYVRKPDFGLVAEWKEASGGRLKILTMSPEWPGSAAFIRRCVRSGLTVSIGHTAATPAQIAEAVAAGASMSTHLGNGAHLSLPRHPNHLWEQLAQDRLTACLIADGFHLPASFLKVAMRVKGGRALLVSDSVHLAGMKPGRYRSPIGGAVVLTREGRLHLASNPALLAGSASPLIEGVRRLAAAGLAGREEAWSMGSERPARAMKLAVHGDRVRVGIRGERWTVLETWKSGRRVYAATT